MSNLIAVLYYLIMDCRENSTKLFSVVHSRWTRGDENKMKQGKFKLNTRETKIHNKSC